MQRRPVSPLPPVHRLEAAPADACRGSGQQRKTSEKRQEAPLAEAQAGYSNALLGEEEWVKASWKKGECREEIKLIAEASGMAFDEARIVVRVGICCCCCM